MFTNVKPTWEEEVLTWGLVLDPPEGTIVGRNFKQLKYCNGDIYSPKSFAPWDFSVWITSSSNTHNDHSLAKLFALAKA